jgi:protein O-mannosyl-transferase
MPMTTHNDRTAKTERTVAIILLIVITSAVYLPVINQEFSGWDDDQRFISAIWKPGWQRAWRIITDFKLQHTVETYYNPLHMLSLMSDQLLSNSPDKPSPGVSKLMNVVYHIANSVLVFLLLLMAGTGRRPAFIGALIFAVHPAQVGTVAWIAERKNVLATLFYLASVMLFLRYLSVERKRYLLWVVPCFAASLLSKPSAVTLPVVLTALSVVFGYERFKRPVVVAILAALFFIALGWGAYVLQTERTYSGVLPAWPYRPFISAGAFWFYIKELVFPVGLAPVYPRWDVSANIQWFSALLAALLGLVGTLIYYRKQIDKWILWGMLFFAFNLVLVSGLIPFGYMSHSFVADHFLYMPMVGVAMIVARALEKLFHKVSVDSTSGKLLMLALYLWVAVLGVVSVHQTWLWRNPLSMWEAALKATPNSFAANNNLGMYVTKRGEYDRALTLLKKAAELAPNLDIPYFNLGEVYRITGDNAQAQKMYAKAFSLNPAHDDSSIILSEILWKEGKGDEAIEFLKKSIMRNPRSGKLHSELGLFYLYQGKEEDALKEFTQAIELDPLLPVAYVQKGVIFLSRGIPDEAIPLLQTAVDLSARADAHNVLGAAYAQKREYRRALAEFRAAYKIQPGFPDVGNNIANALIDLHDYDGAAKFCSENSELGMPCAQETLKRIRER